VEERRFLISIAQNKPDCSQLNILQLAELPAIRWKATSWRRPILGNLMMLRLWLWKELWAEPAHNRLPLSATKVPPERKGKPRGNTALALNSLFDWGFW
jgi:hypothetical protein